MAGTRTGLSATDIAEQFRDECGDGSMEWVYTPMQTWLLLDAADMLDENAELRKERDFYYNQVTENGERAHRAIDALNDENAKLRELVRDMNACIEALCSMVENSPGCSMCLTNQDEEKPCAAADVYCRMRELGVEV